MINRDSFVWWLALAAAVIGYLITAQKPPTEWGYMEWLQAASFVLAWVAGKLTSSPLAGASTPLSQVKPAIGGLFAVKE